MPARPAGAPLRMLGSNDAAPIAELYILLFGYHLPLVQRIIGRSAKWRWIAGRGANDRRHASGQPKPALWISCQHRSKDHVERIRRRCGATVERPEHHVAPFDRHAADRANAVDA